MANIWDDLVKWLDDASKVVGKEAGDLTQKGSLKLEIFDLNRKLRDAFTQFGSEVYEAVYVKKTSDWQNTKKIKGAVRKINTTARKLQKKKSEYKKIGKGLPKKK
ncbi:MAG: hypothetical protein JSV98_00095 [candidate division WOR-3 bacterium]|nr:MAG: hypothetical protein JSV98_00095 [candidate division WOR-3 bacterium]